MVDEKAKKKPVYAEVLGLYKEMLKLKGRYKDTFHVEPIEMDEKDIEKMIDGGFPLLRKDTIEIDYETFERCFLELIGLFEEKSEEFIGELKTAVYKGEIDFSELVKDVLVKSIGNAEEDENGEEEKSWKENVIVRVLIYEALKPVMELYSGLLKDRIKDELWGKGYCPVCGEKPLMAELKGEEGKRIFKCSLCSHEWSFMRVKCPFCENEEQKELGYLTIEGEPNYRINICKKCKGYLKVIDPREIGEEIDISLNLEDVTTLHLDMLAKREGFKKENHTLFLSYRQEDD
jgi:FdhE protein